MKLIPFGINAIWYLCAPADGNGFIVEKRNVIGLLASEMASGNTTAQGLLDSVHEKSSSCQTETFSSVNLDRAHEIANITINTSSEMTVEEYLRNYAQSNPAETEIPMLMAS